MKTHELTGPALDWAVAKACFDDTLVIYFDENTGEPLHRDDMESPEWRPSADWSQGGPIIEREGITTVFCSGDLGEPRSYWAATAEQQGWQYGYGPYHEQDDEKSLRTYKRETVLGPTPLIAAMRCYVASKLGDDVNVPSELEAA